MNTIEQFQQNVFKAIDINSVVWIDDYFAEDKQAKSSYDVMLQEIEVLVESSNTDKLIAIEELSDIDFEEPWPVIASSLPENEAVIDTILQKMEYTPIPELKSEAFDEFSKIFDKHTSLKTISLKGWEQEKATLVNTEKCLFFVDLDFSQEGGRADEGKTIIDYIFQQTKGSAYCVLFTHNCSYGQDEENQRASVIKELSTENSTNFSVLSKSIFNEDDNLGLSFKAPEFLKRTYLRKLCSDLSDFMSTNLKESIDQVTDNLSQCSIYEIDFSLFKKTISEGASEFDVLHRIFALNQKQYISSMISENHDLLKRIKELRNIESVKFEPQNSDEKDAFVFYKRSPSNSSFLLGLRDTEMWADPAVINKTHSPLKTGDTFIIEQADGSLLNYILLEQSCDLALRDNGNRKLNEATLVGFSLKKMKKLEADSKYHYFQNPLDKSEHFVFDFSNYFSINLNYLDLAVFNSDGSLSLKPNEAGLPELVFQQGLMKRFRDIKDKFFTVDDQGSHSLKTADGRCNTVNSITLSEPNLCVSYGHCNSSVTINAFRSGRLNSPFTDVLMRKLYQHKTRYPLEHDFTDFSFYK